MLKECEGEGGVGRTEARWETEEKSQVRVSDRPQRVQDILTTVTSGRQLRKHQGFLGDNTFPGNL